MMTSPLAKNILSIESESKNGLFAARLTNTGAISINCSYDMLKDISSNRTGLKKRSHQPGFFKVLTVGEVKNLTPSQASIVMATLIHVVAARIVTIRSKIRWPGVVCTGPEL